jgi:hypothetical protein
MLKGMATFLNDLSFWMLSSKVGVKAQAIFSGDMENIGKSEENKYEK